MIGISDIKGISIFHKTLGEGRVVDLKKDLLYIQFGDQVKGFKLPLFSCCIAIITKALLFIFLNQRYYFSTKTAC